MTAGSNVIDFVSSLVNLSRDARGLEPWGLGVVRKEVVERTSYGAVSKCNLWATKLLTRRRGDGKKADPATRCVARRRDLDRNGSGLLQLRNRSSRVRSRCGPLGPAGGALVIRPQVLLLDEPLSALDLRLRQQLRREVREIQQELGITTIFVTRDQCRGLEHERPCRREERRKGGPGRYAIGDLYETPNRVRGGVSRRNQSPHGERGSTQCLEGLDPHGRWPPGGGRAKRRRPCGPETR